MLLKTAYFWRFVPSIDILMEKFLLLEDLLYNFFNHVIYNQIKTKKRRWISLLRATSNYEPIGNKPTIHPLDQFREAYASLIYLLSIPWCHKIYHPKRNRSLWRNQPTGDKLICWIPIVYPQFVLMQSIIYGWPILHWSQSDIGQIFNPP